MTTTAHRPTTPAALPMALPVVNDLAAARAAADAGALVTRGNRTVILSDRLREVGDATRLVSDYAHRFRPACTTRNGDTYLIPAKAVA